MGKTKKTSLKSALSKVGKSARRHAFRGNRPVAISENGEAMLVYPDGTKRKITSQVLEELTHANA
jgi:hypothetical protein